MVMIGLPYEFERTVDNPKRLARELEAEALKFESTEPTV
jgi:hypothetical protein